MGGRGSGRRSSYGGKDTTDDSLPLDIRRLARDGVLAPGGSFSWQWMTNGRLTASIQIKSEHSSVTLSYRFTPAGRPFEDIAQTVQLQATSCTFGGTRQWFACPSCNRRVAIIYGAGRLFSCRRCKGLSYGTQTENADDRALRRANRIRKHLGWVPGVIHGHGPKPAGMHWLTFERLCYQHDALAHVSITGMAARMGLFRDRRWEISDDRKLK